MADSPATPNKGGIDSDEELNGPTEANDDKIIMAKDDSDVIEEKKTIEKKITPLRRPSLDEQSAHELKYHQDYKAFQDNDWNYKKHISGLIDSEKL